MKKKLAYAVFTVTESGSENILVKVYNLSKVCLALCCQ